MAKRESAKSATPVKIAKKVTKVAPAKKVITSPIRVVKEAAMLKKSDSLFKSASLKYGMKKRFPDFDQNYLTRSANYDMQDARALESKVKSNKLKNKITQKKK